MPTALGHTALHVAHCTGFANYWAQIQTTIPREHAGFIAAGTGVAQGF